jgi:hypothetical protein
MQREDPYEMWLLDILKLAWWWSDGAAFVFIPVVEDCF